MQKCKDYWESALLHHYTDYHGNIRKRCPCRQHHDYDAEGGSGQNQVTARFKSLWGALCCRSILLHSTDSGCCSERSFFPVPKVDSAVLRLDIRKDKPVELIDERMFFRCIKAGFGQRRKTLSNSLMGIGDVTKEEVKDCLSHAGIDEKRRAETLSFRRICKFSKLFQQKGIERGRETMEK